MFEEQIRTVVPELSFTLPLLGQVDLTLYAAAFAIFITLTVAFWVIQKIILLNLKKLSEKTSTDIDDVVIGAVDGIRPWVYTYVSFYLAVIVLPLPGTVEKVLTAFFLFTVVWQLIEIAAQFVTYATTKFVEKDEDGDGVVDPGSATASHMITLMSRIILWAFGALFVLSNLGIEITSLIAGLGIGGIAIAFALQGILTDLFASFSIFFDRPFRIGDFITIGADSGTVEKIGIKSTRIRTLQGEELVVSNTELTSARVNNFKKLQERRGTIQFGVTYETPHERVKEINGVVKRIFDSIEQARLDRVHFTTFGDSALLFDVVFYVDSAAYADFLDAQQKFNFDLMDRFAEMGVEFAYPTQTIYSKAV